MELLAANSSRDKAKTGRLGAQSAERGRLNYATKHTQFTRVCVCLHTHSIWKSARAPWSSAVFSPEDGREFDFRLRPFL